MLETFGLVAAASLCALIVLAVVLEDAFIYCFTVQRLTESGVWMPASMRIRARVLYPIGALADALYNQTYGRAWFHEWGWRTHGAMFSNRVQWHIDYGDGKQLETAIRWADLLNAVAPNHVKRVDAARVRLASGEDRVLGDTHL